MPRRGNDEYSDERLASSQYPEGGRYVRELLGQGGTSPISHRAASDQTGVNYVTISTMSKGGKAEFGTIVQFMRNIKGGNINKGLRLFGFKPLVFSADELKQHDMMPYGFEGRAETQADSRDDQSMGADDTMTENRLRDIVYGFATQWHPDGRPQDVANEAIRICARLIMRLSDGG